VALPPALRVLYRFVNGQELLMDQVLQRSHCHCCRAGRSSLHLQLLSLVVRQSRIQAAIKKNHTIKGHGGMQVLDVEDQAPLHPSMLHGLLGEKEIDFEAYICCTAFHVSALLGTSWIKTAHP